MKLMKTNKRMFINSAVVDDNVGKLEMYGDVYEEIPIDWWTGQPITDQAITLKDVRNALNELKDCSRLEIHLSSYGGDATVGLTIHNLLKGMNKHITCVIDGIAASAAFTIASACDDVQVYPGSLMMCHKVMSLLVGYYNTDELNKAIHSNEAYDKASAAVYAQKTGMSETQCLNLMKAETWMTGKQAIEYGFANTLLDDKDSSVQLINKTTMKVNGIEQNIKGLNIPDDILDSINKQNLGGDERMSTKSFLEKFNKHVSSFFQNSAEGEEVTTPAEGVETPEAEPPKTEDVIVEKPAEVQEEKPEELTEEKLNSLREEFTNAERVRIQEIEAIAGTIDADLVNEAKYGAKACDAKELAFRQMQREAEKSNNALKELQEDNVASKVNEVESVPGELIEAEKSEVPSNEQIVKDVKNLFRRINKAKEDK